jgi:hypothetical protein
VRAVRYATHPWHAGEEARFCGDHREDGLVNGMKQT